MKKTLLLTHFLMLSIFVVHAKVWTVTMTDQDTFSPSALTISKGDTVTWTNADSDAHTSTSGQDCNNSGLWNSNTINGGGSFSFKFTTAGTFPYHCNFHCAMGMLGTITVNDTGVSGVKDASYLTVDLKAFPNPFTESSSIQFQLNEHGRIKMEVYDLFGKKVMETNEEALAAGQQTIRLQGEDLLNGMFVCKIFYEGSPAAATYLIKSSR